MKQAGQSETYTDGLHHNPTYPSLGHMSIGQHGGWMLEHGDWRVNLGRGLLPKARIQSERTGVRKFATGNACRGNYDCHRSNVPLINNVDKTEPPLQTLYNPAPSGARKGPLWGWPSYDYSGWKQDEKTALRMRENICKQSN